MKNLVSTAKMLLIERATEVFTDRRVDLGLSEYVDHYSDLGKLIAKIDSYINLSTIIADIEEEKFGYIGLSGDDSDVAEFMREVYEAV